MVRVFHTKQYLLLKRLEGVYWVTGLPIFTLLSFRSVAFHMPTLLFFFSHRLSCALQRTLTVLCPLSFQLTMMTCWNSLKVIWFTGHVVFTILLHPVWQMRHVLKAFLSLLERRPVLLKTLMRALEAATLDTLIELEIKMLTINGWSAIHPILPGSIDATLMWSLLPQ